MLTVHVDVYSRAVPRVDNVYAYSAVRWRVSAVDVIVVVTTQNAFV